MNRRLGLLLVDSARDLLRYKSFFLLVFVLICADRALQRWHPGDRPALDWPGLQAGSRTLSDWVFTRLPGRLLELATDERTLVVLAGLFLAKQLVSLWPSSDMRRMHRRERGRFGLLAALAALTARQVAWDALAVGASCALAGMWALAAYVVARMGWRSDPGPVWLAVLGALVMPALPVTMAAFSYSSKIAVLSRGTLGEKLALFGCLYSRWTVLWPSFWFFLARMLVEALFVAAIPLALLWSLDTVWLRVTLAAAVATPVYSYLKMVSFKFFLIVYGRFPLVRSEYPGHYGAD